jgi:NADH dehydrogenase
MYSLFMQYNEVLVTGGTGLPGQHVCRALVEAGVLPRLLVRSGSEEKIPAEIRDRCRATPGDLTVREFAEQAAQGTSAIVHIAGTWKESPKEGITFEEAIVHATRNVLHAAREWGIGRIVLVSVAGAKPGAPVPFLDAKGRAEEMVRGSGLAWTVFRPAPWYNLRDGKLLASAAYFRELAAEVADALGSEDTIGRTIELDRASSIGG